MAACQSQFANATAYLSRGGKKKRANDVSGQVRRRGKKETRAVPGLEIHVAKTRMASL